MNRITAKQWFQIVSGFISSLITGAALLNPLFGEATSLKIVAGLGIANLLLNSVGTALSGQANLVKEVAAMPGVERIAVNQNANQVLAAVATDPAEPKVGAVDSGTRMVLQDTAKGGNT